VSSFFFVNLQIISFKNIFSVQKYNTENKIIWDDFAEKSKNGTFLFKRNFMDYHADRFVDNSLLFYKNDKLIALLPANVVENQQKILYSHQGLTYGGVVLSKDFSGKDILGLFEVLLDFLHENNFNSLIYKPVPHIYHQIPSEEDLYALFRYNAKLITRQMSSTIKFPACLPIAKQRFQGINRGIKEGFVVKKSEDYSQFWAILEQNLAENHQAKPVHSLQEMLLLKDFFHEEISLYAAYNGDEMLAGGVFFDMPSLFHSLFISANNEGIFLGAFDFLLFELTTKSLCHKPYFDFGTSCEDGGKILNTGLLFQKEGFSARSTVYDIYEITI
jgi:hypothetical protein